MIQLNNLKDILAKIGFVKDSTGDYYKRNYDTCNVAVDFDNKKIIYPEDKGLKVHDKTTSNFEHPENFVVLECVCRLLEKGYRPEHIELEPRWTLGHDPSGGKADILVKDSEEKSLIIIECKTAGEKFNKEKKNTEEDGGQLFSYWQQEGSTRWLALYASDYKDENISYQCLTINCTDDANIVKIAEKDSDLKVYKNARNDKERFNVWCETYGQKWLDDVIFCDDSQAYNIGIPPLRKGQLRDFTPDDRIVNKFEEILRHNNVSDKENAFNRLVALFICKLVDEIKKIDLDEVDFQYKQGADTYESLQDRLQRLHQQGMEEFMKEKIFYVEADYAERLFMQYTGRNRKAAIEDLNRTIRILKFYSNNDFAFKDVHNEELFFQNGKILVEVVQLFQPYRIVYPSKHQFLGDLFEQLLNKGFKQNEGQFFTPIPITRFIWDSLPLQHYISNRDLPRIIDYACGAGHFLTEAVEAVNAVRKDADNTWVEKHIYGIEKDYRLARVSKISMFMNGAGGANIIFGDGLENYAEKGITNGAFDILIANPPYSVSGFKQHLKLKNNSFFIIDKITQDGSEIETLFVERATQLLKPQGIAAVILPASILSNSSSSYIAAREQLLKNFMLRAIVNFGSKTFGATGTNTVVLFLERYNEPPKVSNMTEDIVDGILSNTDYSEWQDKEIMEAYLAHQGIEEETYKQFLSRSIPWELLQQDSYFKMYVDTIANSSITYPKNATAEKKKEIRLNRFYDYTLYIERDKLYYFTLAHNQKTLVISAPTDNKEQKTFLGYDWSNRKGAEGIIINKKGGQLYDDNDRFASNTLASLIRYTFYGDIDVTLPKDVEKYAKTYWLRDMIDFSQTKNDKIIRTTNIKKFEMKSRYPFVRIGEVVDINQQDINPTLYPNKEFVYIDIASVENGTGNMSFDYKILGKDAPSRARRIVSKGNTILSTVRPNLKAFAFAEKDYNDTVFSTGFAILMPKDMNALLPKLLYIYFMNMGSLMEQIIDKMPKGQYPSINKADIESLMIPLPPLAIQQKIIDECKKVEEEYLDSKRQIEILVNQIDKIYFDSISTNTKEVKLSDICNMKAGKFVAAADIKDEADEKFKYPCYGGNGMRGYTDTMTNEGEYTIIGRQGALCGNVCTAKGQFHATEHAVVVYPNPDTDPVWLRYHLEKMNLNQYATGTAQPGLSVQKILELQCSIPLFETQKKVAEAIKKCEQEIQEAEEFCRRSYSRKQAVLDKYLK